MKKLIIISFIVAQSAYADFFVQYDNSGTIIAAVWSDTAPIMKNGLNQMVWDKPLEVTGMIVDITKTTKDSKTGKEAVNVKYDSSKDVATIFKVDPNYKLSND